MIRRAAAGTLVLAAAILLGSQSALAATPSPVPSPCPSAVPSSSPSPVASPSPLASPGPGQPCGDQQQFLIDQVRSRLGNSLADALAAEAQLQTAIDQNRSQQAQLASRIQTADARISDLEAQVTRLSAKSRATLVRVEAERRQLRQLARSIYYEPGSLIMLVAQAASLGELLTRMGDMAVASQRARALKSSLDQDVAQLDSERRGELAARDEEKKLRDRLSTDLVKQRDLQVREETSLNALSSKIGDTRAEIAGAGQQSADLALQIEQMLEQELTALIGQAMTQVWQQEQGWEQSQGSIVIPPSVGHSTRYRFIWPEPNATVTQGFGPTSFWFEPPYQGFPHFHTGLDLSAPEGSPILAADDGIVSAVGDGPYGYGHYVVIEHAGGFTTLYGHMIDDPATLAVLPPAVLKVGLLVKQGTVIGYEGSTGNSTGPHLHFELRINGQVQDPSPYLPPGPPSNYRQ